MSVLEFSSESSAWPLTKGKNPEIKKYQSMIYSKGRSLFHWRKANHLFRMQIMIDGKLLKFACIAVFSSAREAKKKKKKWSEKLSPVPLPCCESRIVLRPHSSCLLTAVYSCAVLTKRVIWSLTKNLTLKFPIVEISNSPKKAWQPSFKKSKSGIQVLDNSNNRENLLHIFLGSPQRLLAAHLPAKALLSAQVCYRKVANLWCGLKVFQCEGHLSSLWKTLRIGCKNATAQIFLPPLLLGDLAHKPGGQQLGVASWGSWRSSIVSWIGRFPRLKKQVGLANLNLETIQSTGCLTIVIQVAEQLVLPK